jgi:hypothetical protein
LTKPADIVEAMLQSPRFTYRIESQRATGPRGRSRRTSEASRLSYIIWGGPPDEKLLEAAEKNGLDRGAVESHVRRMLQDRRAVERSRQFVSSG